MRIFKKRKVTPQVLEKIKELRKQGISYDRIAKETDLHISTIMYHLNPNYKEKLKAAVRLRKKNRILTDEEKDYHKNYQKERYKSDKEFRDNQRKRSREYQKTKREKNE